MEVKNIYHTAQQFENTANILVRQIPLSMPHPPINAFIVNVAFSLEMYLKCLLVIETNRAPKKIHQLHRLFEMLSGESQKEIKFEFDRLVQNSPINNMPNTPFSELKQDIDSVLLGMNDAFIKWRYSSLNMEGYSKVTNTQELISAIKKRIHELHIS